MRLTHTHLAVVIFAVTVVMLVVTAVMLVVTVTTLGGCALFVIGDTTKKTTIVERSQRSALGVVYLFKEALDSSNVQAATDLMVHPSGRRLLAIERYEITDDVERWRRVMSAKPITKTHFDTLSAASHRVYLTLDYIKHYAFLTARLDDSSWYVASITEQQ